MSLRIRPLEAGGILTAPLEPGSEADELLPIECEHSFGPSLRLSTSEWESCRDLIAVARASGRRIVGFFRSAPAGQAIPSDYDDELVRELVPECSFMLLAEPSLTGDVPITKFKLSPGGPWVQVASVVMPGVQAQKISEPVPMLVESNRAPRRTVAPATARKPAATRLLLLALAGFIIAASIGYLLRPKPPAPTLPTLSAELRDGAIHLTWTAVAPPSGADAALVIRDGETRRELPLASADLQGGSLVYRPASGDVDFHLRIGAVATAAVRVLMAALPTPVVATPVPQEPQPPATQAVAPRESADRDRAVQHRAPAPRVQANAAPVSAPSAPQVALLPAPNLSGQVLGWSAPTPPQSAVSISAPRPPSQFENGRPQPNPPAAAMVIQEPQPIRRVSPRLSGLATIHRETKVSVEVQVNERGSVAAARVVSVSGGPNAIVDAACLAAARDWIFRPATRGGVPVAGTHLIEFVLHPPQ